MLPVHASFDAPVRCANEALYDADDGGGVAAKWHIVRTAGVVHAMQIAAIYLESTSLMSPMCGELGLSIAQIALPLNVFRAVNVALLMPAGALLDRYGVFRALWPSAVGAAAATVASSLTHVTALLYIVALTKLLGSLSPMLKVVGTDFGTWRSDATVTVILPGYALAG